MKKAIVFIVAILTVFGMSISAEENRTGVYIDGRDVSDKTDVRMASGASLVQCRALFEEIGYWVSYDKNAQSVRIDGGGKSVRLKEGSLNMAVVNIKTAGTDTLTLKAAPQVLDGVLYVPVRDVLEAIGLNVRWNGSNSAIVIITKYESVGNYSDNMAVFNVNGVYGYLGKTGSVEIEPKYKRASDFKKGSAVVSVNGQFGTIDTNGSEIITANYAPFYFKDDIAVLSIGRGDTGKGAVVERGLCGAVDRAGNVIVPFIYEEAGQSVFEMGAHKNLIMVKSNGKWGVIDAKNTIVLPLMYDELYVEHEKNLGFNAKKDGKLGVIDIDGEIIMPFVYDEYPVYSEIANVYIVSKDDKRGTVDAGGNVMIPLKYDYLAEFTEKSGKIIAVAGIGEKHGIIDNTGKVLIPIEYADVKIICGIRMAIKSADGKWGLISFGGENITPQIYDELNCEENGLMYAKQGEKIGYINMDGETIVPIIYDWSAGFVNGNTRVQKDGKFGVIKYDGTFLMEPIYDEIGDAGEFYIGRIGEKTVKIDLNGKTII